MGARFGCFGYAGFSVSSIVAATLIGAAAPAEAVVNVWKYQVGNSSPTSPYGQLGVLSTITETSSMEKGLTESYSLEEGPI